MSDHVDISCGVCGVEFCLPAPMYQARRSDGRDFYCPNGHSVSYRPSEQAKRIAELEHQIAGLERARRNITRQADEVYATREELIRAIKECPGQCGWHSRRQVPRDAVALGRGLERVRVDVAAHLAETHGIRLTLTRELTERT